MIAGTMRQMHTPSGDPDPEIADLEKLYYQGGYLGSRVPDDVVMQSYRNSY